MSVGGTHTEPPSSLTRLLAASTSCTATYGIQCDTGMLLLLDDAADRPGPAVDHPVDAAVHVARVDLPAEQRCIELLRFRPVGRHQVVPHETTRPRSIRRHRNTSQ
jgi:hypothetical protein